MFERHEEQAWLVPVYHQEPLEPHHGQGVILWTREGREILDLYGGHAVALLGYNHPRLVKTLHEQATDLFFQSNAVSLDVRARAAQKLVKFAPEGLTRAFLVNSGAEANENALRLAFRFTRRSHVVALEGAFHGRTAGAAAVTWKSERWYGFPQRPFPVTFVPRGDVSALAQAIGPETAALILEPVQGVAGAVALGRDYLRAARDLTEKAGALLIADEVQSGMGRSGAPFAVQRYGILPDLLTTAKGLAGGFPAGAVLVSEAISSQLQEGDLGTTFGGGPLACAMIEAVIETIQEERLCEHVRLLSRYIRSTCQVGPVTAIQGEGLLLGLRVNGPAAPHRAALLAKGILTGSSGDPSIIRLLPPLILEHRHVDRLAQALKELEP